MLKALDYSHKLLIRGGIVDFGSLELLGKEGYRVPLASVLL